MGKSPGVPLEEFVADMFGLTHIVFVAKSPCPQTDKFELSKDRETRISSHSRSVALDIEDEAVTKQYHDQQYFANPIRKVAKETGMGMGRSGVPSRL